MSIQVIYLFFIKTQKIDPNFLRNMKNQGNYSAGIGRYLFDTAAGLTRPAHGTTPQPAYPLPGGLPFPRARPGLAGSVNLHP
jgi:hypothetical protein